MIDFEPNQIKQEMLR
jgi:hypothetical protein